MLYGHSHSMSLSILCPTAHTQHTTHWWMPFACVRVHYLLCRLTTSCVLLLFAHKNMLLHYIHARHIIPRVSVCVCASHRMACGAVFVYVAGWLMDARASQHTTQVNRPIVGTDNGAYSYTLAVTGQPFYNILHTHTIADVRPFAHKHTRRTHLLTCARSETHWLKCCQQFMLCAMCISVHVVYIGI